LLPLKEGHFLLAGMMRRRSSMSTSFVLAALRALHVDNLPRDGKTRHVRRKRPPAAGAAAVLASGPVRAREPVTPPALR
jgi:hypothetical protein